MKKCKFLLIVAGVCLLAMPLSAQTRTGTIDGSVVDSDGGALPGVTVVVTGPVLQGNRTAITDTNGEFHVSMLPPGADYKVTLSLSGFDTLEQVGIPVNIANVTQLDVTMNLESFGETIEVTADSIIVDTSKSMIDTNVSYEMLDTVYNTRNFQGVMNMVPGVERNANNPRVHGASDTDNVYLVDGVDLSDPRVQMWGTALNFDAVAEVQVQAAGFPAEYGRMQGGVVNLVTKSGGNEFHGVARYIIAKESWAADPKPGTAGGILGDENRPAINFGGPILRDKVWFWLGYEERDRIQSFPRYTDPTVTEQATDSSTYGGDYVQAKVTWQLNPGNTIVGFWNRDPIEISNVWGRYYLGPAVDPASETTQEQGGYNYSLQWTNIVNENMFLEAKYGRYSGVINLTAQGPLGPEPVMLDLGTGWWSGTSLEEYLSDRTRQQANAALTYFLDTASGSHELKGGIEWMEARNTVTDVYYPSGGLTGPGEIIMTFDGDNDTRVRRWDRDGTQESKNPYWALYVQDSWRTGRLTLNFGLRGEQLDLVNDIGETVAGFSFSDMLAPRFGFAYDLNGNSLHGSVGRFYDLATDYLTSGMQPSTEMEGVDFWIDGEWVTVAEYPLKALNSVVDNLKPNYTDEFTVGYDHRLGQFMSLGVNYVWRQQQDMVEDFDSGTSGDAEADDGLFTWGNQPGTWLKYSAVELILRKRFGPRGFQFMTSYTYTLDNEGYATGGATQVFGSQGSDFGDTSVSIVNRYGRLDTPHQLKFDGSWSKSWGRFGLTTGIGAWWWSGNVWAERLNTSVATGTGTEYVEPAGSNEIGSEHRIDLHVELSYILHKAWVGGVYVDVLNAGNQQMPVRVNTLGTSGSFGDANLWQTARRYQLGFKLEF